MFDYGLAYTGWTLFQKGSSNKNVHCEDPQMVRWLRDVGYDWNEMKIMYGLTPPNASAVYKDYFKYIMSFSTKFNYSLFEKACIWQYYMFKKAFRGFDRFEILNIDQVIPLIDRPKSATAFLNKIYANKGDCLDDVSFRRSFVRFLYKYCQGEDVMIPCQAVRKEEIRTWEKIQENAQRSFILASLYYLIFGHCLFADFDLHHADKWYETRTAMGMPLFWGCYEKKVKPTFDTKFKFFGFRDIGKWDSRNQYWMAEKLTLFLYNTFYPKQFISFYDLLGSWRVHALELGLEDFNIDTYQMRAKMNEDEAYGPVMLPQGELTVKNRGTNSGTNRTTPKNCDVHQNFVFQGAIDYYGSYSFEAYEKYLRENCDDIIGDDEMTAAMSDGPWLRTNALMQEAGWEIDSHIVQSAYDLEYVSCKPALVETERYGKRIVPIVNSAKVIAALGMKSKPNESPEEKMG